MASEGFTGEFNMQDREKIFHGLQQFKFFFLIIQCPGVFSSSPGLLPLCRMLQRAWHCFLLQTSQISQGYPIHFQKWETLTEGKSKYLQTLIFSFAFLQACFILYSPHQHRGAAAAGHSQGCWGDQLLRSSHPHSATHITTHADISVVAEAQMWFSACCRVQIACSSCSQKSHSSFILYLESPHLSFETPSYDFLRVYLKQVAPTQAPCVSQNKRWGFFRSRTKWLNIFGSNFSTQNFQVMVTGIDSSPYYLTSLVEI